MAGWPNRLPDGPPGENLDPWVRRGHIRYENVIYPAAEPLAVLIERGFADTTWNAGDLTWPQAAQAQMASSSRAAAAKKPPVSWSLVSGTTRGTASPVMPGGG